jgi:hypothetical protein
VRTRGSNRSTSTGFSFAEGVLGSQGWSGGARHFPPREGALPSPIVPES